MVGREDELREALSLWNQVLAGGGRTLLVSGEPGVGKTRFVRELITQAEITGGRALLGASYAEGGAPYDPLRQIVTQALCMDGEDNLDLPESVLADLVALPPSCTVAIPTCQLTHPRATPRPRASASLRTCSSFSLR
jgi:predicted ATPase